MLVGVRLAVGPDRSLYVVNSAGELFKYTPPLPSATAPRVELWEHDEFRGQRIIADVDGNLNKPDNLQISSLDCMNRYALASQERPQ